MLRTAACLSCPEDAWNPGLREVTRDQISRCAVNQASYDLAPGDADRVLAVNAEAIFGWRDP